MEDHEVEYHAYVLLEESWLDASCFEIETKRICLGKVPKILVNHLSRNEIEACNFDEYFRYRHGISWEFKLLVHWHVDDDLLAVNHAPELL